MFYPTSKSAQKFKVEKYLEIFIWSFLLFHAHIKRFPFLLLFIILHFISYGSRIWVFCCPLFTCNRTWIHFWRYTSYPFSHPHHTIFHYFLITVSLNVFLQMHWKKGWRNQPWKLVMAIMYVPLTFFFYFFPLFYIQFPLWISGARWCSYVVMWIHVWCICCVYINKYFLSETFAT